LPAAKRPIIFAMRRSFSCNCRFLTNGTSPG
jgi:hypothetical protein